MKVKELMLKNKEFAILTENVVLKDAIDAMNDSKLGIACIVNSSNILTGLITDGDLRRTLLKNQKPLSSILLDYAVEHAIKNPVICKDDDDVRLAVSLMEKNKIWDLPVLNNSNELIGLLHLHNAIKVLINK
tara:strand:- start:18170 stop:18565 length:396 start_codon:yes stop_codon:yes gene_type:complete